MKKLHPTRYRFNKLRERCKRGGIDFNLTEEDLIVPAICPYLGIELIEMNDGRQQDNSASIDRIDNNKGYIKGNVEVISMLANRMKQNANKEQLLRFAKIIIERYSNE